MNARHAVRKLRATISAFYGSQEEAVTAWNQMRRGAFVDMRNGEDGKK